MMSKKMTEKDTEDEIKSAFKAFDTNNSGAITGIFFFQKSLSGCGRMGVKVYPINVQHTDRIRPQCSGMWCSRQHGAAPYPGAPTL